MDAVTLVCCSMMIFLILMADTATSDCRVTTSYGQLQPNKALLNHVIKEHKVETDQMCRVKCYINHDCVSYNLGPSQTPAIMVCQLNDADRHQYPQDYQEVPGYSYRGTENKCNENPCTSANQTCKSGFGIEGYECLCPKGFTGEQCETDVEECTSDLHNCSTNATCTNTRGSFECACLPGFEGDGVTCKDVEECASDLHNCSTNATCTNTRGSFQCACLPGFEGDGVTCKESWIQANYTIEVCVGTTGNSFGVFSVPFFGEIRKFKLVHVSGGVAGNGGEANEGNWGNKGYKYFEIHITNVQNQRLAPPVGFPLIKQENLRYDLPGQSNEDPQMIFPEFSPFLPVNGSQVFRVWYGEDLMDIWEVDNMSNGQTCLHVFILYAHYEQ